MTSPRLALALRNLAALALAAPVACVIDNPGFMIASDGSTTAVPDIDGCIETSVKFRAEADGFYIAGGTEGGTTCVYAEAIAGQSSPCKFLNFGVTHGMRVSPRTPRRRTRLARRAWPRTCTRRGP